MSEEIQMNSDNTLHLMSQHFPYQSNSLNSVSESQHQRDEKSSFFQQSINDEDESQHQNSQYSYQKNQKVQPAYNVQDIMNFLDLQINIYTGLYITNDGVVRYLDNTNQFCFGLQQQQNAIQIEDIPKLNIINIQQQRNNQLRKHSTQQAINFMSSLQNFPFEFASKCFQKTETSIKQIRQFIGQQLLAENNDSRQNFKNQEFESYTKLFFSFIEEYSKLNPIKMFHYQISRLNVKLQDMEYYHTGYSKTYLEFLGIDYSSLSQLLLRRKQIDLAKNKSDITNISLQALSVMYQSNKQEYYEQEITTFDGYPIKIKLFKKNYTNLFGIPKFIGDESEYQFIITEIDVDLKDLQQLIQYRQNISQKSNQINIENFLRRELSYLFEDVEYTVDSYYLFEKFYSQNIGNLKEIEQLKKQDFSKVCGYRYIQS